MADNIAITPGTGISVAADDVSSVYYQRVKVSVGADGVATDAASWESNQTGNQVLGVIPHAQLLDYYVIESADTTAQTYAIGDVIGGVKTVTTIPNENLPTVVGISLVDGSGIGPGLTIFFSGWDLGTVTDGAAFSPTMSTPAFDEARFARVTVASGSSDWVSAGSLKALSLSPSLVIPDGVTSFDVAVVATSSYTMATNGHFRMSITLDES